MVLSLSVYIYILYTYAHAFNQTPSSLEGASDVSFHNQQRICCRSGVSPQVISLVCVSNMVWIPSLAMSLRCRCLGQRWHRPKIPMQCSACQFREEIEALAKKPAGWSNNSCMDYHWISLRMMLIFMVHMGQSPYVWQRFVVHSPPWFRLSQNWFDRNIHSLIIGRYKSKHFPIEGMADTPALSWLVGGLEHVFFSHILGISSSQLTLSPSFFRGVGGSTTNQILPSRRYGWIHRDGDWTGQTLPILGGAVPVVVTYIYGGCIISQQNWALFHDDDDWEPYSFSKPSW